MGPTQLNIPRDRFYGDIDVEIPRPQIVDRGPGGERTLNEAADLLARAEFPVMISGGGVVMGDAMAETIARWPSGWAARWSTATCTTIRSRRRIRSGAGRWATRGSKAAMRLISRADVVLALGTRLGPFGTLPQHGLEYWPDEAKIIQVDADATMLGLVKRIDVGICGDAGAAAVALTQRLAGRELACDATREQRAAELAADKADWEAELDDWIHEIDDFSVDMIKQAAEESYNWMHPRQVLRELENAMPERVMVSTDIGNINSVANSYLRFEEPRSFLAPMSWGNCGYALPTMIGAKKAAPDRPAVAYAGDGAWAMSMVEIMTAVRHSIPVTAVVFHNRQWGRGEEEPGRLLRSPVRGRRAGRRRELVGGGPGHGRRGRARQPARRRRPGAGAGHRRADERRPHHGHRGHVHDGAGRSVPQGCAQAPDPLPGQVRRIHLIPCPGGPASRGWCTTTVRP